MRGGEMFPLRVFACVKSKLSILVIPGLDPGIQGGTHCQLPLDYRVKPGNDREEELIRSNLALRDGRFTASSG